MGGSLKIKFSNGYRCIRYHFLVKISFRFGTAGRHCVIKSKILFYASFRWRSACVRVCSKQSCSFAFTKPFFTPGGWHDVKNVYWNVSVGLKCVLISRSDSLLNLWPLYIVVSKNVAPVHDISVINVLKTQIHDDIGVCCNVVSSCSSTACATSADATNKMSLQPTRE